MSSMKDFQYIKDNYKVPAELHREVIVDGKKGVITESKGQYIGVIFYQDKNLRCVPCHPTWKVEYLETFNNKPPKLKNAKSKQRYMNFLSMDSDISFSEFLLGGYYKMYE